MSRIDMRPFMDIPFKDGGRDFSGADCWGCAKLLFLAYGKEIPDFVISCYNTIGISKEIYKHWGTTWKVVREPVEPCLVVMGIDPDHPNVANHLGVYIGDDEFFHTVNYQNGHIDKLDHPYWKNKILGFFVYVG